nr:type II toxin-antitoxin system RelE/ParE family toxin [Kiritimatiellia bacterium]
MYTLDITESAEADLDRITDYIGVVLSNPPAALAFLDEVDSVSNGIADNPEMF